MTLAHEDLVQTQALPYFGLGLAALAGLALFLALRRDTGVGVTRQSAGRFAGPLIPIGAALAILGSVLYLLRLYFPDVGLYSDTELAADTRWWVGNGHVVLVPAAAAALLIRRSTILSGFLLGTLAWSAYGLAFLGAYATASGTGAGWGVDLLSNVVMLAGAGTITLGTLRTHGGRGGGGDRVVALPAVVVPAAVTLGWLSTQSDKMAGLTALRLLVVAVFAGVALQASWRRADGASAATLAGLAGVGMLVAVYWSAYSDVGFYSGAVIAGLFVSATAVAAIAGIIAFRREPSTTRANVGQPAS